jgi:ATP-GRASP peptide maturase of grasp-with-spasm system
MDEVIDWLNYLKKDFIRLNGLNDYELQRIYSDLSKDIIEFTNNKKIDTSKIKSVWFYRWGHVNHVSELKLPTEISLQAESIKKNITANRIVLSGYLMYKLRNAKWLGHYNIPSLNKLAVLAYAQSIGLKIPATLVTNNLKDLMIFKRKHQNIITKAMAELSQIEFEDKIFASFTSEVKNDLDLKDRNTLSPTLVQEKIDKKFEIRSFYIKGKFYSMAIFSQSDPKTTIDFRKYNDKKPNRNIPFNLPKIIQNKLIKLFESLNLNTGSVDIIYNTRQEYIFLEINPVGQYGMTSKPCNYYLEKLIAESL